MPVFDRIGVRPGLDRPPVITSGDHNCVHAVHDAFVVGGSPVRVNRSESPGCDNTLAHFFRTEFAKGKLSEGNGAAGARQATVGKVGEDTQVNSSAGDGFYQRCQPFGGGVNRVGTHCITHVVYQMQDQE